VRCGIREAIYRKNGRGESLPKFIGRTKVNRLIWACINKTQRFRLGFCQLTVSTLGKMFSVVRVRAAMVSNVLWWRVY
jgi:hypothetical protein